MMTRHTAEDAPLDYAAFYQELFRPIEERIGPLDPDTIVAIIGFDAGGPVNLCTVGRGTDEYVTYVSCELAVNVEQVASSLGRYELMLTCDDEAWASEILSELGRMSLEVGFDAGHTIDIGPWVEPSCPTQGLLFEEFCRMNIGGASVRIMRVIGVTRLQLRAALEHGAEAVIAELKSRKTYPMTRTRVSASAVWDA